MDKMSLSQLKAKHEHHYTSDSQNYPGAENDVDDDPDRMEKHNKASKAIESHVAKKFGKASSRSMVADSKRKVKQIYKSMYNEGVSKNMDTPGNSYEHQCAIHVKSESFGEGRTITTQHADVDENGHIAWYDVMFEHGIEKYVPTDELEILVSESHMHSMKKKKKVTEAVRGYVNSMTGARPPADQAERDALAKEINANRDRNRSDTSTTGYGNRVTPQKGVDSAGTGGARGPVVTTGDFDRASPPQGTRVDPKATGGYGSQMKIPAGSGKMGGGGGGGMGTTDPFGRRGNPLKQ